MRPTKTVLVTGAAKRLGRAIALDLAGAGWNVAIHYHCSAEDAEATAQAARANGVEAHGVAMPICPRKPRPPRWWTAPQRNWAR